ncbi:MAG: thiol reductase thioredoxin [Legionellales bacterium]|nr:thiol reductase thioredoxin [Legionellales bacterium]|tara:strand:- start:990 stop:1316 length:327 start_codon:yes stop_codon:yes gene_type:complete
MSDAIQNITDASFDEIVIGASKPVLVDFWAPWCGPCKMIAPILDELAGDYADRLAIVKMNVDEQPDTAAKYNVRGIPTLLIFKDGELASTHVGLISKSDLVAFINKQL